MSTPMYDIPEHEKIGLTLAGWGPIEPDDPDFHHWGCWCGDPKCEEWR